MRCDSILDAIGDTPTLRLALPGPGEGWAKLELQNLFAMKDRVARQVVRGALRDGVLRPGAPIIESSSGTMALGLALVGRSLGHPVHIVTDPRIDAVTHAKLLALGCRVHVVERMSGAGWQSARLELLARLLDELPGAFWPQQYSNPDNPAAYTDLADELLRDLGRVDVLVGAVGSGGSLCGTAAALRQRGQDVRVVAVDCVGSMIFGQPDRPQRLQGGLGNSMQAPNVDYGQIDEVHWLSDEEAFEATRALAREQQLFAGNSSGSVYRVLAHLTSTTAPGTTVVGILPDRGDRYVPQIHPAPTAGGPIAAAAPVARPAGAPARVRYGDPVASWSCADLARPRPRLLFVESNTTGSGMQALRTAHRLAVRPVLLTADPDRYPGLAGTRAEVVVVDTADPDAVLAAVRGDAAAGPVAGVTTTSEYYLPVAAAVAERLGVPTDGAAVVRRCRDKSAVRAALTAAGLPGPRWQLLDGGVDRRVDPQDVRRAIAAVGLPCVVKPVADSGSTAVRLCRSEHEVTEQVAAVLAVTRNARGLPTPSTVLVEELLSGPEFSVELLGTADAPPRVLGVTAKRVVGAPWFVEAGHVFPAPLDDADRRALVDHADRVVAALGLRCGALHLEIRLTPAGPALVEVNARPAGGMIPELVRSATGTDVLEQHLRAVLGMPVDLTASRERTAGIAFLLAGSTGTLRGCEGVGAARAVPGVEQVVVTAAPGRPVRPPRDFSDRLGHVIAVGGDADEVSSSLALALRGVEVVVDAAPSGRAADPATPDRVPLDALPR